MINFIVGQIRMPLHHTEIVLIPIPERIEKRATQIVRPTGIAVVHGIIRFFQNRALRHGTE
jgi:hypothetical protein